MKKLPLSLNLIPLAILAGGEGSRMGGLKGLLRIGGKPILEYLLERIAWPGPVWLITAPGREHPPGWQMFDRELVDPTSGLGPLRGLLTALESLQSPLLIAATVDMPGVRREHLHWLASQLWENPEWPGIMCHRHLEGRKLIEPFPLALRPEVQDLVRSRLRAGKRSVHGLTEHLGIMNIPAPMEWSRRVWINLNQPTDVEEFETDDAG